MDFFSVLVEGKIQEAMENGEFDNLPGAGKPLELGSEGIPPALAMAYRVFKNAFYIPREIELMKELEQMRTDLANLSNPTPDQQENLQKEIILKESELNLRLEALRRKPRHWAP